MSGSDSSPKASDEADATRPSRLQDFPTRGIEPERPYSPPPPPDFGNQATTPDEGVDHLAEAAYSQPVAPPQHSLRPWSVFAIVAAIVAVLVLMVVLVVAGVGSILSNAGSSGEASRSSETDDTGRSEPTEDRSDAASDPASVELSLQATIDAYKSARDSGALWATIDDTEYNRTALSAFLYFLTDLKLAASFGADTSDYLQRADELERRLLNGEPLGSDISITLSDRTFTYDGDTGEGGYTDN